MELTNNTKNMITCLIIIIFLFTTSIHIDLGRVTIRIMSINNVISYKEKWIFIGNEKNYEILLAKELEYLQKLKDEKRKKYEKLFKRKNIMLNLSIKNNGNSRI